MHINLKKNIFLIIIVVCMGIPQMSCSTMKNTLYFWSSANEFEDFEIVVDQKANQNSAIAFDLIFAYDKNLIGKLEKINAQDWFKERDNYRLNFPTGFDVVSWELVPGQVAPKKPYPAHMEKAAGIFIFANYSTQNDFHRARVDQLKYFELNLGELNFTIKTL